MKIKKSALTLALALAIVFGMMVGANAADTLKTITASLNYGITIKYNGNVQEMKDANGNRVYPISYEGTTYLPVRAVSNMLGIEVNWDGPTNTVWLGDGFVATPTQPASSGTTERTAENNYGFDVPPGYHVEMTKSGKYRLVNDETGYSEIFTGVGMMEQGYVAGEGQLEAGDANPQYADNWARPRKNSCKRQRMTV